MLNGWARGLAAGMALAAGSASAAPVQQGGAAFTCPAPVAMPNVPSLRSQAADGDAQRITLDEEKAAEQAPFRRAVVAPAQAILTLADSYRASQVPQKRAAIARCALRHLLVQADARALEGAHSSTDEFYRSWILGRLATAWLKLGGAAERQPGAERVHRWLGRLGDGVLAFHQQRIADGKVQNHLYWGGFALAAEGLANADRHHLNFARRVLGIGLDNVDAAGLLAAEAARGHRARHYHLFAAAPLAGTALLLREPLSPDRRRRMGLLAAAVAESFAEPGGGRIARAAGTAPSAEANSSALALLRPFATDPLTVRRLGDLTLGVAPVNPFLGGRLDFLIDRAVRPR
jgi:poly(beta-D-mannuronate) lyase